MSPRLAPLLLVFAAVVPVVVFAAGPPCLGPQTVLYVASVNLTAFPVKSSLYTLVLPELLASGSCMLVNTSVVAYATAPGMALVTVKSGSVSIVVGSGCAPVPLASLSPAYVVNGSVVGVSDVVFALQGFIDVGGVTVASWGGYSAKLVFVPPTYESMVSSLLSVGGTVDTSIYPYTLIAYVKVPDGETGPQPGIPIGFAVVNATVSLYGNGTLVVGDTSLKPVKTARFNVSSTQRLYLIAVDGRLLVYLNSSLVANVTLAKTTMDGFIVYQAAFNETATLTAYLYAIVVPGVAPPPEFIVVQQSTIPVAVEAPEEVYINKWYLFNVTIESGPKGIVYAVLPGGDAIASASLNPPGTATFNVTINSEVALASCIDFLYVVNGTVLAAVGAQFQVLVSRVGGESWVITLTIPKGGHGYIIYADGHYKVQSNVKYVLVLAGFGYAGCTVNLDVQGTTVYSRLVPATALDVFIPFNFTTPAKVVITKSVSETGCTVDISVTPLQFVEVVVKPPFQVMGSEEKPESSSLTGILTGIPGLKPEYVLPFIAAFASTVAIVSLKSGASLSTSLALTALLLFALGLLFGQVSGSLPLVTISILLLGLALGLKLGYR